MKRFTRFPVLMLVLGVLAGCASSSSSSPTPAPAPAAGTESTKLVPKDATVLDGPSCSLEAPECPEDLMCASLDLETGRRTLCVPLRKVCEQLQCARGECVVLESYPAQIRCAT
ncbi:hypothetical protein [Pyxidicoccus xibeiensis]|uniref:hypothetical protein n=1 Tax=Pyxidicoccus xibeiensis TaxID=2906759 RepID=UPI0020A72470|nr:hypothetical protein [Pyxidicoccus xibeiensis]MCP3136984.1 hypothetical protein [Pyxidicoccus xibeiensis]